MPSSLADYAAIILACGSLLGGIWAYLNQRAALADERDKRKALEKASARKDDLDALRAIIGELRAELSDVRDENEKLHIENRSLRARIADLEAVTPAAARRRLNGPLS